MKNKSTALFQQVLMCGYEPMTNVHPGVKMATAVSAYKFENNGYKSCGKLGLAIIGWQHVSEPT